MRGEPVLDASKKDSFEEFEKRGEKSDRTVVGSEGSISCFKKKKNLTNGPLNRVSRGCSEKEGKFRGKTFEDLVGEDLEELIDNTLRVCCFVGRQLESYVFDLCK